jgi:hypothetical protein
MFSINPSCMLALETLKTTLKPLKKLNNIIYTRVRALTRSSCAWHHPCCTRRQQLRALRLAPANPRLAPSPEHTSQACCLLSPHQCTPASCNNIIFKAISNTYFSGLIYTYIIFLNLLNN